MLENNIFKYATSELSQDAFICWLISFINNKNNNPLYKSAKLFMDTIFRCKGITEYENIVIRQQTFKIDILLIVNNRYVVIIEDKTFSSEGKDQIQRYKNKVMENKGEHGIPTELHEDDIICVYYKIVEQPQYNSDYVNITRKDILSILEKNLHAVESDIYHNYYDYLKSIDEETKLYSSIPIEKWRDEHNHIYRGFFAYLQREVIAEDCSWGYVPNASNGFWGLWWYGIQEETLVKKSLSDFIKDLYLQIEDNQICVKVTVNREVSNDLRWSIFNFFYDECTKEKVEFKKKRFRQGTHITIGYVDYNFQNHVHRIGCMERLMKKIENESIAFK